MLRCLVGPWEGARGHSALEQRTETQIVLGSRGRDQIAFLGRALGRRQRPQDVDGSPALPGARQQNGS